MSIVRPVSYLFCAVLAVLVVNALLSATRTGHALPAAGTDLLNVTAQVDVKSLLGSETVPLSGTVTIERGDPVLDGDVEVVDMEVVDIDLAGESLTGTVTVHELQSTPSLGEIRSLQPPPDQFPASSFLDVFVNVEIPASPSATVKLHTETPIHLVPSVAGEETTLGAWPPVGVTFQATPDPCVPLLPQIPAEACIQTLVVVISDAKPTPPSASPTVSTPTLTVTPGPSPTPTKQPEGDTDRDGCSDIRENGSNEAYGGRRDYRNFWDFYDPTGDGSVTISDAFAIIQRFAAVGDPNIDPHSDPLPPPAYHTRFDRGPVTGPNAWNLSPADGAITTTDLFSLVAQFGHVCVGEIPPPTPTPASTATPTNTPPIPTPGPTTPTPTHAPASSNDDFINAWTIPGVPFSDGRSTATFTLELNEPSPSCKFSISKTAWYVFTAPQSGSFTLSTAGSNFDTVLAVYTGVSFATLSETACNDDSGGLQSTLSFSASSGITYLIQVGSWGNSPGGNLVITLEKSQ